MRLIDADEVIRAVGIPEIEETLNMFPTRGKIEHSKWVRDEDGDLICERCGSLHGGGFSYCSYCGAKMDEE